MQVKFYNIRKYVLRTIPATIIPTNAATLQNKIKKQLNFVGHKNNGQLKLGLFHRLKKQEKQIMPVTNGIVAKEYGE